MEEDYVYKHHVISGAFYGVDKHRRVFFCEDGKKEQVTSSESLNQSNKFAKKLAEAYNKGYYKGSY